MNKMIKGFWVCVALLTLASIICIVCSEIFTSNGASIVGGILSAAATALLGGIALWQNKQYKELADELNERTYMPELYKVEAMGEWLESIGKSKYNSFIYTAVQDGESALTIDCGQFRIMKSPILNVSIKRITCASVSLHPLEQHSLYANDAAFSLRFKVPSAFVENGTAFEIVFTYENMYGTQYEKIATFEISRGTTTALNWKLHKAQKVG